METCFERWEAQQRLSQRNGKVHFFCQRRNKTLPISIHFRWLSASYYDSNVKSTLKRMLSTKSVVVELRSTRDLPDAMAEFKRFLAMQSHLEQFHGRREAGRSIDFSNEMSRAVVITGLPFPAFDPKVVEEEF
jgi:hypothetical protein